MYFKEPLNYRFFLLCSTAIYYFIFYRQLTKKIELRYDMEFTNGDNVFKRHFSADEFGNRSIVLEKKQNKTKQNKTRHTILVQCIIFQKTKKQRNFRGLNSIYSILCCVNCRVHNFCPNFNAKKFIA